MRIAIARRSHKFAPGLAMLAAFVGCGREHTSNEAPSWQEFRAAATRHVDGREIYVVEWDRALTLDGLRVYYDQYMTDRSLGVSEQMSIVNQVGGRDDVWSDGQQLQLTYCVSNDFGANHDRAITEMDAAARDWEAVANVDFRYVSGQDDSCNNTNASIVFSVRPWTSAGACSFFPSGGGCVPRTLVINIADLDSNPYYTTNAPNVRTVGVFRHELGHVLGLRHEHIRPESGAGCLEDSSWRVLTPYDQASVMHYPWCNGVLTSDLSITAADAAGVRQLYSDAPAEMVGPTPGSVLPASSVTFSWTTGRGVSQYYLYVGSSVGAADLYAASQGTATSGTVSGLPADGRALYVRLWSFISTGWQFRDYTYTAAVASPANLYSPAPGSALTGSTVTFSWTTGVGVSQYYLYVGSSVGGADLYAASQGLATSGIVSGLPADGRTLYVRLWSFISTGWQFLDYAYTAAHPVCDPRAGSHGQMWVDGSANSQYVYHDGWCGFGTSLPTMCWQGTYYYYQYLVSDFCSSVGSAGSCYDPDAWWWVTCSSLVDCVYNCSGQCVKADC